jgi:prolyl oligopeptidase
MPAVVPPKRRKDSVSDTYFGVSVADPYRWLEDGDSAETRAFTDEENALTESYLAGIPDRDALSARVASLLELGVTSAPAMRQDGTGVRRYFHMKRTGAQSQAVLYVREGVFGEDRPLVDPASLSVDGTTALDWWYPSRTGELVAWGRSESGSEESTLYVRDVMTGADLAESIPHTRHATVAWLPDGSGFYYSRFPEPGSVPAGDEKYGSRIFFHALGTDPRADELVFGEGREKTDVPGVSVSPDGRWVVVTVHEGWDKSEVYLQDRAALPRTFRKVAGNGRVLYGAIARDDRLYLHTNDGAPRYALYAASYHALERAAWTLVLPEHEDVLEDVAVTRDEIVATYLHDAASRVARFSLQGHELGAVELPAIGTASVSAPIEGGEIFVSFTSFVVPPEVHRLDTVSGGGLQIWERVATGFTLPDVDVLRLYAQSKDGTRVPMFVIAGKGLVRHGRNPTVLYGYGGFNVNQTPGFSARALTLVERGGVWVSAVLRGGGEFGEAWHKAGMLENKQNVFDDFYACAEALVSEKITSPETLAAMGGSNGGLLVAVAVTQRPELFRAGLSLVPLTDMLRYHLFRIGKLWVPEYGSSEDAAQFRTLHAYSPYHRVQDGVRYPSMLFTTAESDSRVDPLHARKMAARMRGAQGAPEHPILLRVESKAGHGAGKPLAKVVSSVTSEMAFVLHELGR